MNIEDAQDLFESEIFDRYGPSSVNISRTYEGYLDHITNSLFQDYFLRLRTEMSSNDWFKAYGRFLLDN